jgi:hypothetical protein
MFLRCERCGRNGLKMLLRLHRTPPVLGERKWNIEVPSQSRIRTKPHWFKSSYPDLKAGTCDEQVHIDQGRTRMPNIAQSSEANRGPASSVSHLASRLIPNRLRRLLKYSIETPRTRSLQIPQLPSWAAWMFTRCYLPQPQPSVDTRREV